MDLTCSARSLAALEKELALQQDLRTRGEKELEARCEENHHLRDLLADMDRKNGALQEALRLEEAKLDEIGGRLSMVGTPPPTDKGGSSLTLFHHLLPRNKIGRMKPLPI